MNSTEPLVCEIVVVGRTCVLELEVGSTMIKVFVPDPLCVDVYSIEPLVCVVVTVICSSTLELDVG